MMTRSASLGEDPDSLSSDYYETVSCINAYFPQRCDAPAIMAKPKGKQSCTLSEGKKKKKV